MAKVRRALGSDFAAIVAMAQDMHDESPRFSKLGFLPERCLDLLAGLSVSPMGLVLVAEQDGLIVGMLGGIASKHFFSDDMTASEALPWFVGDLKRARDDLRVAVEKQSGNDQIALAERRSRERV